MEETKKKKDMSRSAFGLIKNNFKGIYLFHILFKLTILLILFPLLNYIKNLILIANQTSSITMANLMTIAKNPLTWLIMLAIVLIATFFACIENFANVSLMHASWTKKKTSARVAFSTGAAGAIRCMIPYNWAVIVFVLFISPFSKFFDNSSVTRYFKVPGFILETFGKYPAAGIAYILVTIILGIVALKLSFAFYAMYMDKISFIKACKVSWKMTNGRRFFSVLWTIVKFFLIMAGIMLLVLAVVPFVALLLIKWLEPGTDPTTMLDDGSLFFAVIPVYLLMGILLSPIMKAAIASKYFRFREENGEEIPEYEADLVKLRKGRVIRILWAVMCAVILFFSVPQTWREIKWVAGSGNDGIKIMAHRGNSAEAPENTIPAFEMAYEAGADAIELDVQMTKDGQIIIMHDDNTKRTTGVDHNIWEVTYDEIKDLDNGSYFSKEFAGTKIPTLEEAIACCKGRMFINIEIKRNGHDEGITDKVVEIIRKNEFQNECDITSMDYDTLVEINEKYPDILLAYTTALGIGEIKDLSAVDILSIEETSATAEVVESLHKAGKKVFVWTVNDDETMEYLIGIHVDAILTNDTALGVEVLSNHQGAWDKILRMRQIIDNFI